jgi:acyl dehydratase
MTKVVLNGVQDLATKIGEEVAVSDWLLINQQRIENFANATNDRQWIHVDVDRAQRDAPGGKTIAHGFLTLALIAGFGDELLIIKDVKQIINCGLNKVRFLSPVPVGSELRARFVLAEYKQLDAHSFQVLWRVTVEIQGGEKPACVADLIYRYYIS